MPVKTLSLNGNWKLTDADCAQAEGTLSSATLDCASWMPARVPGDVHHALIAAKRIEDPFYGMNSQKCKWTGTRDWWYRHEFTVPKSFTGDKVELVFDGIDTYGTVWLNGTKIGDTSNMFRQYRFNVTGLLKADGPNTLAVCIRATLPIIEARDSDKYFACFYTPRIFARKAQCQFSWDWAPFLPSIGIWLDVRLEAQTDIKISDVHVRTRLSGDVSFHILLDQRRQDAPHELDQKKAHSQAKAIAAEKVKDWVQVEVFDGAKVIKGTIEVTGRKNFINLHIPNPKFWWPVGYGEPQMYQYRVTLLHGDKTIHARGGRFGIREVKLLEDVRNESTTGFTFLINGVKIFCQGANKVPNDCFPSAVTKERYERVIELAKDANMNMIRIWGGGIYEKDEFYDLCDENGIMIWHDLMFACSDIPDDEPKFIETVLQEFVYQLKRLRNHPSIVYWCGCNEKTGSAGEKITFGDKIYHYIGRGVVNDLMPDVPYRPASPHSFNDAGNNPNTGDTHAACWEDAFRNGMDSFRKCLEKIQPVFHSEFGFHGPCQLGTIKKFIPKNELWPLNGTWHEHIHDNPYSSLSQTFMQVQQEGGALLFHDPKSVNDFVKVAGTLHAELIRAEFENDRQRKFANAGSMVWMLNDCWPSASWSIIDYYGIPKQAFYAAKRALKPLLVSLREVGSKYQVYLTNDLMAELEGTLLFEQQTVEGKVALSRELKVNVPANSSIVALEISAKQIKNVANSYLFARFEGKGLETRTTYFHKLWKEIEWPEPNLGWKVLSQKKSGEEYLLNLEFSTERYARCVYLSSPADKQAFYSDNYFDMIAGETKRVTIRSAQKFDPKRLKVQHWKTIWD